MKLRWYLFLCIFALATSSAFSQGARTITNADLQKFREQRVQAQRDLRDNYEQLGFSSPEERARRDQEWRMESMQLSERFERERAQREAAQSAADLAEAQMRYLQSTPTNPPQNQQYTQYPPYDYGWDGVYNGGNGYYYPRPRYYPRSRFPYFQDGHASGGVFWPSGTPIGRGQGGGIIQRRR